MVRWFRVFSVLIFFLSLTAMEVAPGEEAKRFKLKEMHFSFWQSEPIIPCCSIKFYRDPKLVADKMPGSREDFFYPTSLDHWGINVFNFPLTINLKNPAHLNPIELRGWPKVPFPIEVGEIFRNPHRFAFQDIFVFGVLKKHYGGEYVLEAFFDDMDRTLTRGSIHHAYQFETGARIHIEAPALDVCVNKIVYVRGFWMAGLAPGLPTWSLEMENRKYPSLYYIKEISDHLGFIQYSYKNDHRPPKISSFGLPPVKTFYEFEKPDWDEEGPSESFESTPAPFTCFFKSGRFS